MREKKRIEKRRMEMLIKSILKFLRTKHMKYAASEFYRHYAEEFGTPYPSEVEKAIATIRESRPNIARHVLKKRGKQPRTIDIFNIRVDYEKARRIAIKIEGQEHKVLNPEPGSPNLPKETMDRIDRNVLDAKSGKRPGPPARHPIPDPY